ncbi:uncharacterized protein ZBAI_01727 [Zygosaccharomyces bailii ISA1307]|nr:uncharacterized protein ZBAI_01727 [Zygosaccharomyces bailii ISA1307]
MNTDSISVASTIPDAIDPWLLDRTRSLVKRSDDSGDDDDDQVHKSKNNGTVGVTVGVAVAVPVGVCLIVLAVVLWFVYRRNKREAKDDHDPDFTGDTEYLPNPSQIYDDSQSCMSPGDSQEKGDSDSYLPPKIKNRMTGTRVLSVDPFRIPERNDTVTIRDFARQVHDQGYGPYQIASNSNSRNASSYELSHPRSGQHHSYTFNALTSKENVHVHNASTSRSSSISEGRPPSAYHSPVKSVVGEVTRQFAEDDSGLDVDESGADTSFAKSKEAIVQQPDFLNSRDEDLPLTEREEEDIKRMRSVYKVYWEKNHQNGTEQTTEYPGLPTLDPSVDVSAPDTSATGAPAQNHLMVPTAQEQHQRAASSIYSSVPTTITSPEKQAPFQEQPVQHIQEQVQPAQHIQEPLQGQAQHIQQPVQEQAQYIQQPMQEQAQYIQQPMQEQAQYIQQPMQEQAQHIQQPMQESAQHIQQPMQEPAQHIQQPMQESVQHIHQPMQESVQHIHQPMQQPMQQPIYDAQSYGSAQSYPQQYTPQQYPPSQFNMSPMQYAPPSAYGYNMPMQQQYQRAHPQTLESIDELPTPTNLPYSSSSLSLTSFRKKPRQAAALPPLQAARVNGTALNPMDHPEMFYSNNQTSGHNNGTTVAPYQMRQSVVMTNPSDLTLPTKFRPAGSIRNVSGMNTRNNSMTTQMNPYYQQQVAYNSRVSGLLQEEDVLHPSNIEGILPHNGSPDDLRRQLGTSHNYNII